MDRKKILIVDDEKNLAIMLKKILENIKYDINLAFDGQHCLELARELNPDFILLDIKMPKKDGIGVLSDLRSDPKFKETPIVVLSAKGQLHEISAGIEAGASAYLCKPVMIGEIVNTIERYLS